MHATDHVHHVAVAFDRAVRLNANSAGGGDATEIIARQVDEHDVLSILFGIRAKLGFAGNIDLDIVRPRSGSCDGTQLSQPAFEFDERFRR